MRSILFTFSLVAATAIPAVSFGQMNNGRSGSSGMGSSGSSSFGSSGTSGFGSGSSFGSAGFGTFGSGSSSATGNGFGAMGNGGGGMGMGMGQQGMGMGQQQGGGFLGVNSNQFLGTSAGGQNQQGRNGMNGMNGMGMNGMGGNNRGGGNRGNLNTMNSMLNGMNGMNSGANRQQPAVRPRQKVAFDYPAPKVEEIHTNMNSQLQRIAIKNPGLSNVMLTSEGPGQMVLRGAVKSEADAKLAANLVRLEPGVRTVRSELTFPPESTPAE